MTVNVSKPAINVREELADLRKPSGIAGEAMLRADTPQEQFNLIGAGRRNLIINGDFQVWQRGTSFSSGFTADRWYTAAGTVTKDGFAYKHIATNTDPYLLYKVEDIDNRLAGKDAVFSFYLKTSSGANRLQYLTFCGTNYLHDAMYQLPSEIGGYTRWACPVKITDANTDHIRIVAELEAVNGNISYLRQVQLELGKVATPFEHRSYGEELALCQRYFQRFPSSDQADGGAYAGIGGFGNCISTTNFSSSISLPVTMRVEPTMSPSASGTFRVYHESTNTVVTTAPTIIDAYSSVSQVHIRSIVGSAALTVGNGGQLQQSNDNDAHISLDSEL